MFRQHFKTLHNDVSFSQFFQASYCTLHLYYEKCLLTRKRNLHLSNLCLSILSSIVSAAFSEVKYSEAVLIDESWLHKAIEDAFFRSLPSVFWIKLYRPLDFQGSSHMSHLAVETFQLVLILRHRAIPLAYCRLRCSLSKRSCLQ